MKTSFNIKTQGDTDIIDITDKIQSILSNSKIESGIVNVFVVGSTAGLSFVEYEPGLVEDLQEVFEKIAPKHQYYHHHERWQGNNGNSHIRATLLKPDVTIPFENNKLCLGTWQQVVLLDFDTSARNREILVTIISDR